MTDSSGASVDRPGVATRVERAVAFAPLLKARATETEANRRVASDVMANLAAAELLGISKPRRFGGLQYGPSALLAVGSELARACSSTGWCAMLANGNNWFASYWPLDAQADVWAEAPDNLICGTVAPTGKCRAVEGGFELWGSWPFASNSDNSAWAFVSAMVPQSDGPPEPGWFLTPMSMLEIDQSSWHVSGMQGTGSKTLRADDPIFVPAHRAISVPAVARCKAPGCQLPDNPMARFAFSTFGAVPLVAAVIGMAMGALDSFVETMKAKVKVSLKPGGPVSAAADPFLQARLGEAAARIRAARTLLESELAEVEPRILAGHAPSVEERLRVRHAIVFAAAESSAAVNTLMQMSGASSADTALPLQRFWRDIHAASRHVSFDAATTNVLVAQHLLGLECAGNF